MNKDFKHLKAGDTVIVEEYSPCIGYRYHIDYVTQVLKKSVVLNKTFYGNKFYRKSGSNCRHPTGCFKLVHLNACSLKQVADDPGILYEKEIEK